jgi:MFS family permease
MLTYLDRVCFGAAGPEIARDLGLSGVEALNGAFTAFAVAYALFEIPTGWLGDRLGPKGTLLRIVAWWSACTALTGLVGLHVGPVVLGGLGWLVALRFLFGAGEAGAYPNITRAIHNWFGPDQWAAAQGFVWMSGRLMGGLTPLVWTVLVSGTAWSPGFFSWRGAFLLFGVLGFVWCAVFAATFRNHPPGAEEQQAAAPAASRTLPFKSLASSGNLWLLCAMYFCVNYGWYFHVTYLVGYMKDRYGLDDQSLLGAVYKGGPLWVGAAGCVLGGFLAGRLTRRLGDRGLARKALGASCLGVCAACWLAAPWAPHAGTFFLVASAAAFFTDLTLGSAWATCQDVGRRSPAVTAACMNTVGALGAAAAGWFTGAIVLQAVSRRAAGLGLDLVELSPAQRAEATLAGYQSVFWSYAAVYAVAASCWLVIRPTQPIGE